MMRKLLPILMVFGVLLGSVGVSESADFQKGLGAYEKKDYATALREWTPLAEQGNANAQNNGFAMMWGIIAGANGYKDGTKLFHSLSKGMTSSARSAL